MNEREMLELAAKAAGYEVDAPYYDENDQFLGLVLADGTLFNSKENDGDALRLAVKLGADIQPKGPGVEVWIYESRASSGIVDYGDNPYAATRLAITRAAAESGRDM